MPERGGPGGGPSVTRRRLTAADREIWDRVARTVSRQGPPRPAPLAAPAAPPRLLMPDGLAPDVPAPFRIGEKAATRLAPGGSAPIPRSEPPDAPLAVDKRTHRAMTRGKLSPEARLDLHGMTLVEAEPALRQFVLAAHGAGRRLVLVITGKGGRAREEWPIPVSPGALKRQVPVWLHRPPLAAAVQQVSTAHRRHGGDGALYVYLRRRR